MNKLTPLLSVAIATKNRQKYCIESIKSILAYNESCLEIAIADNSETDEIKNFIENLNSPIIRYQHDSKDSVSSIENFNRALSLTTGKYIILIGDDDSILPKLIEIVKWADENDIDSICSVKSLEYYWPNVLAKYPNGVMMIPPSSGKITRVNINEQLSKLLKNGLQLYLLYSLPKTYHGIVKRSIMEEVKKRTGHYYGGLSPDLYSSIAVSCIAKNHYLIDEPISVAGVCASSTSADNLQGKHSGSLDNIPHLRHRSNYEFSKMIPLYYSVNTVWAESGLKALEELNEIELLKKFNIHKLVAQSWIHNRKHISLLMKQKNFELYQSLDIRYFNYKFSFLIALIDIAKDKIIREIKNKIGNQSPKIVENLSNISEAIKSYQQEQSL